MFSGTSFAQSTTVTAAWDANTDGITAGYIVYYGTASGNYQWSHDAGTATTARLTLNRGSVYYVAVRGYNGTRELGPASSEATINLVDTPAPEPAPTATLTAAMQGATAALVTWQTSNATSVTINGVTVAASGSQTVNVTASTTFTLVARNAAGASVTRTATVTPPAAPAPTATLTAAMQGATAALVTWQTSNATSVTINGASVGLSGSQTVNVTGSTTFTLVARNAAGASVTRTATVTPPAAPAPTATLTAAMQGSNAALVTWQTSNATSVTINGAAVGLSGSQTVNVTGSTTFTLVARNAAGASVTRTATVTPPAAPAPTATLTAAMQGSNAALVTWQTTNATSVTLNGAAVALSGSQTVNVTGSTTFTLVARNAAGVSVTRTATVTPPAAAPAPTATLTAAMQNATTALVTWQTTNATSVTLNGDAVALNGSRTVNVTGSTTFTLVARNAAGTSVTRTATVTPPPASGAFTASISGAMQNGTTALIVWQTTNASSATLNGDAVALNGSRTVTVTRETSFMLVARNASGASLGRIVTVSPSATSPTAPTARISATLQGSNAVVSWQTTNAARAAINGMAVALSGSASVPVSQTTTFTLVATSASGATASDSATVNVTSTPAPTAPNAPTNLAAAVDGDRVTLAWGAPAGGAAPDRYLIDLGTSSGSANLISAKSAGNVLKVSSQLPKGTYFARVRAANAKGISVYSNEVSFRIGRTLHAPKTLTVRWQGAVAVMSWEAPQSDGTPENMPTEYVLEAGTSHGAADLTTIRVGSSTVYQAEIPPGTYYIRVRGVNAYGESDPTPDVVVTPPGQPAPSGLSATVSGATVELRWNAAGGGATGYVVEVGSAPGLSNIGVWGVGNTTRVATPVPPGTYYVRVRATNGRGVGPASNEVIVRR